MITTFVYLEMGGIRMKLKFMSLLFIITLLTGCNNGIKSKEHLDEIYTVALDSIMQEDQALNDNMAFIAIDMSNFNDLDENSKEDILNYFEEAYKVEVLDATSEQLEEMSLNNQDTNSSDGLLLKINNIQHKFNNTVLLEGSKHRSGLGAIGLEVKVQYEDKKWETKEISLQWFN